MRIRRKLREQNTRVLQNGMGELDEEETLE